MRQKSFLLILAILILAISLVAWKPLKIAQAATTTPTGEAEDTVVQAGVEDTCVPDIVDQWMSSAHADAEAEAFRHWDEDDPAQVPANCAKCHSTPGYLDFLGEDGSEVGIVDDFAPISSVIVCQACHNPSTRNMTAVVFPSGAEVSGLGSSARCAQCHQGRSSTVQVNAALESAGAMTELDSPNESLRFVNIHYYAAAATLYGSDVSGGYEYEGELYQPKFEHVAGYGMCVDCHDPHTLQVKIDECSSCHDGVVAVEQLREIRMQGSLVDYDGDGDIDEGIYYEISGLQDELLHTIQQYASSVANSPIAYSTSVYPYFFVDKNENGQVDEEEADSANGYKSFTGRLLQAAYNYQASVKDPGAFAHNAKYVIQLLNDSINDLYEGISTVSPMQIHRNDPGHFDAIAEAFRHWDEEENGLVPSTCSRCHTADGLPFLAQNGVMISFPPSDSLKCITCHQSLDDFTLYELPEVTFPSGAKLAFENDSSSNLCLNCHQGRESTVSINEAIVRAGVDPDEVSEDLSFRNPHYFAAGATLFGSEAQGAYQYDGKEYNGRFNHVEAFNSCSECHDAHSLEVRVEGCSRCHSNVQTQDDLRECRIGVDADYDGDGNTEEGICGEIRTAHTSLLQAIQAYAENTVGTGIVYSASSYPYWFVDTNGDGEAEEGEVNRDNRYSEWTPRLLRAAYNYQYVAKDPGAFAHNGMYILQVLYDSLQDLSPDVVASMTRPELREE